MWLFNSLQFFFSLYLKVDLINWRGKKCCWSINVWSKEKWQALCNVSVVGIYLKGGTAVSSSLSLATITATQSDSPSGCVCSRCFAEPLDPSKLSSSMGVSLAEAGKPTSCTLTLTSWRVVSLAAGLLWPVQWSLTTWENRRSIREVEI